MAVHYVGDNGPDGSSFGSASTDKISFYGATPVTRPSITAVGTTTATTALNETRITRLYTALVNLGLIVTA